VGIEDINDILDDFDQALRASQGEDKGAVAA
jgi:cystathionine beta-lyase/cystathionine gamma-synthase